MSNIKPTSRRSQLATQALATLDADRCIEELEAPSLFPAVNAMPFVASIAAAPIVPIPFVASIATAPIVPRMTAALTAEQKKEAKKARLLKLLDFSLDKSNYYTAPRVETPVMKIAHMDTVGYVPWVPEYGLREGSVCVALFNYDPDDQINVPIHGRMSNWYKGTVHGFSETKKDVVIIHFEDGKRYEFNVLKHVAWGVLRFPA